MKKLILTLVGTVVMAGSFLSANLVYGEDRGDNFFDNDPFFSDGHKKDFEKLKSEKKNALVNGDFETGNLTGWSHSGDVGVLNQNVLEGFSAFLTTAGVIQGPLSGTPAIGDANSFLISDLASPEKEYRAIKVSFLVRYKTDEFIGPFSFYQDPFHAELVTGQGAVDLLTIKTDGISWIDSDRFFDKGISTKVKDMEAEEKPSLSTPIIPTFVPDDLFMKRTHTLAVKSLVPVGKGKGHGTCDPARIKFSISDWVDTGTNSAAFIDDVRISFVSSKDATPCLLVRNPISTLADPRSDPRHEAESHLLQQD